MDGIDQNNNGDFSEPMPFDLALHSRFVDDPATVDTGIISSQVPDAVVDIGAYEFVPGDYDGDGTATLLDFQLLATCLSEKAPIAAECRITDANNDGHVNLHDFSVFQITYDSH